MAGDRSAAAAAAAREDSVVGTLWVRVSVRELEEEGGGRRGRSSVKGTRWPAGWQRVAADLGACVCWIPDALCALVGGGREGREERNVGVVVVSALPPMLLLVSSLLLDRRRR